MDDGAISVGGLVFIARWLAKLRGAWEPGVRFGSPRQEATESHLSWWHVPITLRRRFYQFATIKRCVIELQPPELPEARLPIAMRWRSRDAWNGISEVELQAGRTDVVPLAIRDERTPDGHAVSTNETFLNRAQGKMGAPAWEVLAQATSSVCTG